MTNRATAGRLLVVALAVVALSGCGRPGKPKVPDDAQFPLHYPNRALNSRQPEAKASTAVFVDPSVARYNLQVPGYANQTRDTPLGSDEPGDSVTAIPSAPGSAQ